MVKAAAMRMMERNWKELKSFSLWKAMLAEMVGTSLLVLFGCGTCIGHDWQSRDPTIVQISLTFGLTVATIVHCMEHISGGHINPAVTCAMFITRRASVVRATMYIAAQLIGSIYGAAILKGITPVVYEGDLGQTSVDETLRACPDGLTVEASITFILVLTIFASCETNKNDRNGSAAFSIGFAVAFCHMFAIKYTGSSMNPARSFGPAVMGGNWSDHYVFWVGPILGAVIAGLSYDFIFARNAGIEKFKHFFTEEDYNGDSKWSVNSNNTSNNNSSNNNSIKKVDDDDDNDDGRITDLHSIPTKNGRDHGVTRDRNVVGVQTNFPYVIQQQHNQPRHNNNNNYYYSFPRCNNHDNNNNNYNNNIRLHNNINNNNNNNNNQQHNNNYEQLQNRYRFQEV